MHIVGGTTEVAKAAGSATERRMQTEFGTQVRAQRFYDNQMLDYLNEQMREFVARQEMMFVSTANADGDCDSTFRAGPPGFIAVLDDRRVAWPEYRGNGVLASLANIADNPHAGLLFVDFFRDIIGLHVNGRAEIVDDEMIRAEQPDLQPDSVPGRRSERWVVVNVEEAYVHCRKHIPRLAKRPSQRSWGVDDARAKGGDFFGVAASRAAASGTSAAANMSAVDNMNGAANMNSVAELDEARVASAMAAVAAVTDIHTAKVGRFRASRTWLGRRR